MSYYNNVYIIFGIGGETPAGVRTGCQALPSGAVPLCVINGETKTYHEIINAVSPQDAFDYLLSGMGEDEETQKEIEEDICGEYELVLSVYPGWGFDKGDTLEVSL